MSVTDQAAVIASLVKRITALERSASRLVIPDGAITNAMIAANAVTLAKMAADSVDSDQYVDGSIDTAHIAANAITLAKMAVNSVDSDQYVDGSIDTAHIADGAITDAKLDGIGWSSLTPASGFGAPSGVHTPLAYRVIGSLVFIVGTAQRTGGNVGSAAPTIITTVPTAIKPAADSTNGSVIVVNNPGNPCRLAQIRTDGGLRAYGAFNTNDNVAIQLFYNMDV